MSSTSPSHLICKSEGSINPFSPLNSKNSTKKLNHWPRPFRSQLTCCSGTFRITSFPRLLGHTTSLTWEIFRKLSKEYTSSIDFIAIISSQFWGYGCMKI
jgi:hypothetical protein